MPNTPSPPTPGYLGVSVLEGEDLLGHHVPGANGRQRYARLSLRSRRLRGRRIHGVPGTTVSYVRFHDQRSFEAGALYCLSAAHGRLDDRHLLTIAAHGEGGTGTLLRVERSRPDGKVEINHIDLHRVGDFFNVPLSHLLIYLPVCWGAYPAAIVNLWRANTLGVTTLIGAIVDVRHQDAVRLQSEIIDILLVPREPTVSLVSLIRTTDRNLRRYYRGRDAFRIAWRSGTGHLPSSSPRWLMYPAEGDEGFGGEVDNRPTSPRCRRL